jgi:hypothetical protein
MDTVSVRTQGCTAMKSSLCIVLVPSGRSQSGGGVIDFDAVYTELIAPAVLKAGLTPLRIGEDMAEGALNASARIERLMLCDHAVIDVTTAAAASFYSLGFRHAVRRPAATVAIYAEGRGRRAFNAAAVDGLPYRVGADGKPTSIETNRSALTERLRNADTGIDGSSIYQLVQNGPDLARLKTDVFREQLDYSESVKQRLKEARKKGRDAVQSVAEDLEPIADQDGGVVIDLFLSYRAVKAWDRMIDLVDQMAPHLASTVMVLEQLGLALNRAGRGEEAEAVLTGLIARCGPSSETCGILGRVYKDRWEAACQAGDDSAARQSLQQAIQAYLSGFEADWRDAYPGVNAVTLMEIAQPPDPRRDQLLPVVAYAVERRMAGGKADYWDHATRLELRVLAKDQTAATAALTDALSAVRESWEPETTARNLALIRRARSSRGEDLPWAQDIETTLLQRSNSE